MKKSKTHKKIYSECLLGPVVLRVLCCSMCFFVRSISTVKMESPKDHSLHGETAALVLLKLSNNGYK